MATPAATPGGGARGAEKEVGVAGMELEGGGALTAGDTTAILVWWLVLEPSDWG